MHQMANTSETSKPSDSTAGRNKSPVLDDDNMLIDSDVEVFNDYGVLKAQYERIRQEFRRAKTQWNLEREILESYKEKAAAAEKDVARLRRLRDEWHRKAKEAILKCDQLEAEMNARKLHSPDKGAKTQIHSNGSDSFEESSEEDFDSRHIRTRSPPPTRDQRNNRNSSLRRSRSPSRSRELSSSKQSEKYPDLPEFRGEEDADEYEAWKLHAYSKIRKSSSMFPFEQDKIDYVRDRCKRSAFVVVQNRASHKSEDPYPTLEDMFEDLDQAFGNINEEEINEETLHGANFQMGVAKKNETLDEFITRFRKTIRPLTKSMTQKQLAAAFRRNLSKRLQGRLADGTTYNTLAEIITKVKKINVQLIATYGEEKEEGRKSNRQRDKGEKKAREKAVYDSRNPRRPSELFRKLINEGICIKCGEKGHKNRDDQAPCKDKKPLSNEEIQAKISSILTSPSDRLAITYPEN